MAAKQAAGDSIKLSCNLTQDEDGTFFDVSGRIETAEDACKMIDVIRGMTQAAFGAEVTLGGADEEDLPNPLVKNVPNGKEAAH